MEAGATPMWGMLPVRPLPCNGIELLRQADCPQIRKAVFETGLKFDQHRRGQGLPPVDEVLLPAALKLQE